MVLESPPPEKQNGLNPPLDGPTGVNSLDLLSGRQVAGPTGGVTDASGKVNFPNIFNGTGQGQPTSDATAAAPAQPTTHDYTVKRNDNLWNIAKQSLTHGDRHVHVNGEQVWQRIREIVDLNHTNEPGLRPNPFFIWKGEHLHIPGAADAPGVVPQPRPEHVAGGAHGHRHRAGTAPGSEQGPHGSTPAAPDGTVGRTPEPTPVADGGHLANALKGEAAQQARHIDTVGDCARGPRQTLAHFGLVLRPMSAVNQGRVLENSGMFDRVDPKDVKPGDYGYRHWSKATINRRGLGDLGDSFIVTNCTRNGWQAANDHMFTVPPGGGYYAPGITFLRPNAKFYAAYENYKKTGQATRILG
jgi:hypothetical protein